MKNFKIGDRVALIKKTISFYTSDNIKELFLRPGGNTLEDNVKTNEALSFWDYARNTKNKTRGYIIGTGTCGYYLLNLKNKKGSYSAYFNSEDFYRS